MHTDIVTGTFHSCVTRVTHVQTPTVAMVTSQQWCVQASTWLTAPFYPPNHKMQFESVPKRRSFLCRHILFATIACMSAEVFLIVTTSNTRSTSHFSLSRQQELHSFVEASNYKRSDTGWKFQQNKTETNSLARNLNKSIRRWGCGLTDTPFIFGKGSSKL